MKVNRITKDHSRRMKVHKLNFASSIESIFIEKGNSSEQKELKELTVELSRFIDLKKRTLQKSNKLNRNGNRRNRTSKSPDSAENIPITTLISAAAKKLFRPMKCPSRYKPIVYPATKSKLLCGGSGNDSDDEKDQEDGENEPTCPS